ncbi:crotonase/enoyl-CoA hydratase family protein [Pseudoalteromonas sp. GB56]
MITLEIRQHIAYVTFSRAEKRNSLNFEMFQHIDSVIKKLKKDRSVRAVIINAEGEDFCTGLDVKGVMAKPKQVLSLLFKWLPGNQNLAQRVTLGWQSLNVPVIAVIQGRCWGGGMQIALGADYRIVTPSASFAVMEARWGLCPDMGASLLVPGIMKADDYLRLAMSAEAISAKQALEIGLVSRVEEQPMQVALALIDELKQRSPDAIAAIKRLNKGAYRYNHRRQLAKETIAQVRLLMNKNTRIAIHNATHDNKHEFKHRKNW